MILPVKQVLNTFRTKQSVDLDEVMQVGQGTANFVGTFKPYELGRTNVKALLLKDEDYSTPHEHYFGYINKRQNENEKDEFKKEMEIMQSLGLDIVLPPTYNIEKGVFEEPKLLDASGTPINLDEIDVFELARLRGNSSIAGLKELMNDRNARIEEGKEQARLSGQKHAKKDYDRLKKMSMHDVMLLTKEERRVQKFEDPSLDGIVKVEKKKNFKKQKDQREKDQEISKLLESPQEINYDKAMQLYDQQPLEAKDISVKDKRRLRRLKKKAEGEASVVAKVEDGSEVEKKAPASSIIIESAPSTPTETTAIFGHENVDAVIR